ncbi:MAG TPA: helix-hairpin-helix domain-containing protein, partial [Bacteroidia bacterium]|nr:helix-hairpin-helix domain-containing protein [Bacteroidia bacterium]
MRNWFRNTFSFTRRERNGAAVLIVILIALSAFTAVSSRFVSRPQEDFSGFDKFIAQVKQDSLFDSLAGKNTENKPPSIAEEEADHVFHQRELFQFDPNGLPVSDWVRLGLTPAQARSVKHYEESGGKFESKEDVKRLYVVSPKLYADLEPYILLPDKKENDARPDKFPAKKNPPAILELNTADSALLVTVNGIGPVFAKRIIEYREKLGGFY